MKLYLGLDIGAVSVKAALLALTDGQPFGSALASGRFRCLKSRDGKWTALVPPPRRTRGQPLQAVREALADALEQLDIDTVASVVVTGSGGPLVSETLGARRCNEFQALARAIDLLHPEIRTVFEIGGERSKFLQLEADPVSGSLQIRDYSTNGDCAAGTGGFLDQQAGRLHYEIEDVGGIVGGADRAAQIAGRCSVFAKSDMIHAQQKGFTPPEVLRGLCKAVALNFKMAVVKGRTPERPIAFVGGVSANSAVVRELADAFELTDGAMLVPEASESLPAVGAALLASQGEAHPVDLKNRLGIGATGGPKDAAFDTLPALTLANTKLLRDTVKPYEFPADGSIVDGYLGLDIGSVGTKLVVIDAHGQVIHSIFTRTDGRPIEVVSRSLRELNEAIGSRVRICGVGSTGSGRELIGELVGADSINDEITCHKTGAGFVGDNLLGKRPDTIFEIGGQDSKYISLQAESAGDTIVVDFTMNEACAAGTGSFLEERAEELGVAIRGEFSELALSSKTPIRLGERCTVFMERDVNTCMQRGAHRQDVIAGLAYSVVYNYINRVVRGRPIGDCIFFQGGTACNDAVVAAFSAVTGKQIIVPPHNAVLGAIGAALLAREKMTSKTNGHHTRFRGYDMGVVDYTLREFTCKACTNQCSIQEFKVEEEKTFWGDKCSDRYRKRAKTERKASIPDLVALRHELLKADDTGDPAGATVTIGVPMAMYTWDLLPLWRRFWRDCGFKVAVSSPTNRSIVRMGADSTVAEPCFPIIVAHGHVVELIERGVDYLWVPNILSTPTQFLDNESHVCPWGQTLPFVLRQTPVLRAWHGRILCPTLEMRKGYDQIREPLLNAALDMGVPAGRARKAIEAGLQAFFRFRDAYLEAGRKALQQLKESEEAGVVLVGRPYNIHDAGVSLSVATKLRDLYGVNVLPIDCLPLDDVDVRDINENMYWAYGRRIIAAGKLVAKHPNLHIIYITNFKCGPDSFVKGFIRHASGKPFLSLQFDGHSNDAGMMTRCEAYLDSKGILRWWRKQSATTSPDGRSTSHKWPTLGPVLPPRRCDPSESKHGSRPQATPKH
jgi:predicted CoA-substrate-specific enzyme activase